MTFTYDVTTTLGQMRLLIGDTAAPSNFSDEELNAIVNLTVAQVSGPLNYFASVSVPSNEVLFMAAATAIESLACKVAASGNGQTIQIGDYKLTGKDQVSTLQDIANRYREAINNLPAWGIVEENSCGFNELTIIRNWVLRTEV